MFSSPGKPPPTMEAVKLFMKKKVDQNLVYYDNNVYKATKELRGSL